MNASPATTLAQDTDDASEFDRLPARVKLLDAIFTIAARHDKVCQMYDRAAYAYYGITADSPSPPHIDDAPLNDLRYKVIELCATIAEAALSRLPPLATSSRRSCDPSSRTRASATASCRRSPTEDGPLSTRCHGAALLEGGPCEGPAQRAARLLEARIGELLGPAQGGFNPTRSRAR